MTKLFKIHSYTPRPVRPIRNDVTKSTWSALNVYKGTPCTNATRDAQRYAVQHKATRAKRVALVRGVPLYTFNALHVLFVTSFLIGRTGLGVYEYIIIYSSSKNIAIQSYC